MASPEQLQAIKLIYEKNLEIQRLKTHAIFSDALMYGTGLDLDTINRWDTTRLSVEDQIRDAEKFEKAYDALVGALAEFKDGDHPFFMLELAVKAKCPYMVNALIKALQENPDFKINTVLENNKTLKDIATEKANLSFAVLNILTAAGAKFLPEPKPNDATHALDEIRSEVLTTSENNHQTQAVVAESVINANENANANASENTNTNIVHNSGVTNEREPELSNLDINEVTARILQLKHFTEMNGDLMTPIAAQYGPSMIVLNDALKDQKMLSLSLNSVNGLYHEIIKAIATTEFPLDILTRVINSASYYEIISDNEQYRRAYLVRDLIEAFKDNPNFNINAVTINAVTKMQGTLLDIANTHLSARGSIDTVTALITAGAKRKEDLDSKRKEDLDRKRKEDLDSENKPVEQQSSDDWQFMIDFSNKMFGSNFNRNSYIPKKGSDKKTAYAELGLFFFMRMFFLPVLSTVYVFSRLALIVLNPLAYRHNPAKASLMLAATLMATGVAVGLAMGTSLFTAQTMMNIAGSVFWGSAVVGLAGMVAFASLLHLAKVVAQDINKQVLEYDDEGTKHVDVTAPKHRLLTDPTKELDPVEKLQKAVLIDYYYRVKKVPALEEKGEAAHVKKVLKMFEQVAQAKKDKELTKDMVNDLNKELSSAAKKINTHVIYNGHVHAAKEALKDATVVDGKVLVPTLGMHPV